jgi:hypothetical protein
MWRDRQDRRGSPALNEQISRILFQTPLDGEVAERLAGRFTGPQAVNRLAPAAEAIRSASGPLSAGAGSGLAQPQGP